MRPLVLGCHSLQSIHPKGIFNLPTDKFLICVVQLCWGFDYILWTLVMVNGLRCLEVWTHLNKVNMTELGMLFEMSLNVILNCKQT